MFEMLLRLTLEQQVFSYMRFQPQTSGATLTSATGGGVAIYCVKPCPPRLPMFREGQHSAARGRARDRTESAPSEQTLLQQRTDVPSYSQQIETQRMSDSSQRVEAVYVL